MILYKEGVSRSHLCLSSATGSSRKCIVVDVRPVSGTLALVLLLLLQLPYRLRRRGVTRRKRKKKRKKKRRKEGAIANEIGRTSTVDVLSLSLSLSIHSSVFFSSSSSSFLDGGTRFHFNTSLQKPFFNRKKKRKKKEEAQGLDFQSVSPPPPPRPHFKLIKINPIIPDYIAHIHILYKYRDIPAAL